MAGIAIDGGKIVAIGNAASLVEARKTINVCGNHVIPGIIDTHVHLGLGHSLEECSRIDTAAAAIGGITTIGHYLGGRAWVGKGSYAERFDE